MAGDAGVDSGADVLGSGPEAQTRVMPIYVFSLLGLDAGTLLDHRDEGSARCGGCLAVAGQDMIVAMQAELPQEMGTSTQESVLAAERREQVRIDASDSLQTSDACPESIKCHNFTVAVVYFERQHIFTSLRNNDESERTSHGCRS